MNRPPSFAEFMAMQEMTPAIKNQTAPAPAAPWGVGNAPGLNLPVNPQDKYSGNIAAWNEVGSQSNQCPPGMQWAEDLGYCYATPGYGSPDYPQTIQQFMSSKAGPGGGAVPSPYTGAYQVDVGTRSGYSPYPYGSPDYPETISKPAPSPCPPGQYYMTDGTCR